MAYRDRDSHWTFRDNGFNVIVGQRQGKTYEKAVEDGWVPGETLFGIEEACDKATIIMCLLSDAAVMSVWPTMKPYLTAGKALYFSHGFAITWNDRTGVVPPADIDVIMVAPKGSGTSLRSMFPWGGVAWTLLSLSIKTLPARQWIVRWRWVSVSVPVICLKLLSSVKLLQTWQVNAALWWALSRDYCWLNTRFAWKRPYSVGSFQWNGWRTDSVIDAVVCKERYGLDVR